ncbi:hypothetical protein [Clostridium thermobutyricum]|nr:hypothetical protein [Clostridium thermobutyricum]
MNRLEDKIIDIVNKAKIDAVESKNVLILIFKSEIKNIIKNELGEISNIELYTIYKFMQEITEDYDNETSELRKKFCNAKIDNKWDTILIDETQGIYGEKYIQINKNQYNEFVKLYFVFNYIYKK